MIGNILCLILLGSVFILFGNLTRNDPDFKDITVTRTEKVWFCLYLAAFVLIIIKLPIYSKLYASIALPMLLISAYTDKKSKLLYNAVFYFLAPLSVILETTQAGRLSLQTLSIIIFVVILELFGMYGNGDKGMAVVCGCSWYLMRPEYGSVDCMLAECVMLLVAEVLFYLKAIREKNLNGPFKLKESRPLGPDLLFATTLLLFGGSLLWVR